MSMVMSSKIEKCKGAMLATAIGDALGWPNEPRSKNRRKIQRSSTILLNGRVVLTVHVGMMKRFYPASIVMILS